MTFDLQPTLEGPLLRLRPLQPEDFEPLYAVACDPAIWAQHPCHDRWQRSVFRRYFDDGLASGGALLAIDRSSGAFVGSSRYHGYDAARREIEIGWTFLARSHWGGGHNHELKRLMLLHAFRFVATVLFYVGSANVRSQLAVERIGARRRGIEQRSGIGHVVYELTPADCTLDLAG